MSSLVSDAKEKLGTKTSASELSIEERIELLQQARNYVNAKAANLLVSPPNRPHQSAASAVEPNLIRPCTSYVLSRDEHLESNVERWIANADNYEEVLRLRRDATIVLQQQALTERTGRLRALASLWYMQYMLTFLPLISLETHGWCSPRNSFIVVVNAVESFAAWVKGIVTFWQTKLSQLNMDQVLYDGFVLLIDVVLGLHAIVILLVSFYQQQAG